MSAQASPDSPAARRQYARSAALLLVTAISLYLLLPSLVAVFSSWRSLSNLDWAYASLIPVGETASFVCVWQLDRIALRTSSWFVAASAQLSGNAVGRILPGGGATATAFTARMLRRANVDSGKAAAAFGATAGLQIGTRLALPLLAVPAIIGGAQVSRSLAAAAYLGLGVLVFLVAFGVAAFAGDAT